MNMTLNKIELKTSTCWNEKYQPLTIDMIRKEYTGRYRLGLSSLFVPDKNLFYYAKNEYLS